MGGAFSCGQDNEDLINILIVLGYIKSKNVERVFREVDRGDYVLAHHRHLAYKDLSWKHGNIHLSAPCIYSKVMEGLSLKPGLSFLNIGSGTGYLSTMAGLILGENGTNHGIEMYEDCLIYADEHLKIFKEKNLDVDNFEFCEPTFQLGNFLNVIPNRQYDRVYCGAACPEIHLKFVKRFVKIGGILVMPYKDHLLRIERIDEINWHTVTMLPVTFATLASPQEENERGLLHLPLSQPITLQELCRGLIRRHLRKIVWSENDDLEYKTEIESDTVVDRPPPQFRFGIFDESNQDQPIDRTSETQLVRLPNSASENLAEDSTASTSTSSDSDDVVLDRFEIDLFLLQALNSREEEEEENSTKEESETEINEEFPEIEIPMEEDKNESIKKRTEISKNNEIDDYDSDQAGSLINRSQSSNLKRRKSDEEKSKNSSNSCDNKLSRFLNDENNSSNSDSDDDDDDENDLSFALIKKAFSILKDKYEIEKNSDSDSNKNSSEKNSEDDEKNNLLKENDEKIDDDNSDSDDDDELIQKKILRLKEFKKRRTEEFDNNEKKSNFSDDDDDIDIKIRDKNSKRYFSNKIRKDIVTNLMKNKINQLPLPLPLRIYINFNREL